MRVGGWARSSEHQTGCLEAEAEREAAAAQSLCAELAKMKTELQLKEGAVAQAVLSADVACAETLQ
jgi:hypothetical protein